MITNQQAEVLAKLMRYDIGYEINPLDVFPYRDAVDNGRRRIITKLAKDGILAQPDKSRALYAMTQRAIDEYRQWYKKRGFKTNHNYTLID